MEEAVDSDLLNSAIFRTLQTFMMHTQGMLNTSICRCKTYIRMTITITTFWKKKNYNLTAHRAPQTAENIPCVLMVGVPFWERTEVKDLLAYLRLVASLSDDIALERIINVPARKIGKKSQEMLGAWAAARGMSISGALFGTDQVRPRIYKGVLYPEAQCLPISAHVASPWAEIWPVRRSILHAIFTQTDRTMVT